MIMMTDKTIIKALECCLEPTKNCKCCPFYVGGCGDGFDKSKEGALYLIKRQQAEIERLKKYIKQKGSEKAIPKKPTHEATLYKCFTCPRCKNVIDEFEMMDGVKCRVLVQHCKFCGQALDWGGLNNNGC